MSYLRCLPVPALLFACTVHSGLDGSSDSDGGAGGKADGFGEVACPAEVGINDAPGGQRRCFDERTGQFAATICCADLCTGAGWREQANGPVCAWLGEPELDGAAKGQFAPSMCCELNDDLACSQGELDGKQCRDPKDDAVLDAACCAEEPPVAACHPLVESSVRECVRTRMWEPDTNIEVLPMRPTELLEICTAEGDVTGPMRDELCATFPDESVCQLDFQAFSEEVLRPCAEALRPQFDCAFGTSFRDIARLPNNAIVRETVLTAADIPTLGALEREQVLLAARQSAFDDVASVEQAFERFDGGELNLVDFVEIGSEQAFRALEFGAGDNSFGVVVEHGSTALAAVIHDSDLLRPTEDFALGCDVPFGIPGLICSSNSTCGGKRCEGAIEHPAGIAGRCIDHAFGKDSPKNEARCTSADQCPLEDGLICSGLTQFDEGFCRPAWVLGRFSESRSVVLPKKGKITRDLFVYGLATVPEDAWITLRLVHNDLRQLKVTLIPALQEEGTPFVVFDGKTDPAAIGNTSLTIDRVIAHSGDESLNGRWSLVVEDTKAGTAGTLDTWSLRFSSRMD